MKSAHWRDYPFLFSLEMDQWNYCALGTHFKKKLHQVAFPLTNFHIAYNYADWTWNNRKMNPVSPQSSVTAKNIHKPTLPTPNPQTPAESHFYI